MLWRRYHRVITASHFFAVRTRVFICVARLLDFISSLLYELQGRRVLAIPIWSIITYRVDYRYVNTFKRKLAARSSQLQKR